MEEFLRRAQVIRQKPLSVRVTNSQRATLEDSNLKHDAHIQTVDISKTSFQTDRGTELNFRDCYRYNMACPTQIFSRFDKWLSFRRRCGTLVPCYTTPFGMPR
jgi:hypothetical protein